MLYCKTCGSPLGKDDLFCRRCGAAVPGAEPPAVTEEEPAAPDADVMQSPGRDTEKNMRARNIILIAAAVLMTVVVIVLISGVKRLKAQLPARTTMTAAQGAFPVTAPAGPEDAAVDPTGWTTAEIIDFAAKAVNGTKAYTGAVTARHTEKIDATITKITGGVVTQPAASGFIKSITAPIDETLEFRDAKAVDQDVAEVDTLLPVNGSFTLSEDGVSSASATRSGGNIVVNIVLAAEYTDMNTLPRHNEGVIGHFDPGRLDLGAVNITSMDMTYVGSTIKITVLPDGYVRSASYSCPMHIDCTGSVGLVKGSVTLDGVLNESWELAYAR